MKEGIMKPYPASKNKTYLYYTRLEKNINTFLKKLPIFIKKNTFFMNNSDEYAEILVNIRLCSEINAGVGRGT